MSETDASIFTSRTQEPNSAVRPVGGTEYSWCKAALGGTGITVLALLLTKPLNLFLLQASLAHLKKTHPILRSKLVFNPISNTFFFVTPPDLPSTTLLRHSSHSALHEILENELNLNPWSDCGRPVTIDTDLMFASVYYLGSSKCVVVLRFHTGSCDRSAAVMMLRELTRLMSGKEGEMEEIRCGGVMRSGIEDLVPEGKGYKPFWTRGVDVLGYSLNSFRLANLGFLDISLPRRSEVVRLQIDPPETAKILEGCKARGIKLCGAMAAAGLIAAHSSKGFADHRWEKYSVVTLMDCRSLLQPPLSPDEAGFYHSAIQNTHDINGGETLWQVATRTYGSFLSAKNNNKHFSDMGDLGFLMCRAIDAPALTPSSSLRTCFVSVFEETVIDEADEMQTEIGVDDYLGCASVHGIGPSIAIFDTIRDGRLDCAIVYPAPLHSREQIQGLVDDMKRILLNDESNA